MSRKTAIVMRICELISDRTFNPVLPLSSIPSIALHSFISTIRVNIGLVLICKNVPCIFIYFILNLNKSCIASFGSSRKNCTFNKTASNTFAPKVYWISIRISSLQHIFFSVSIPFHRECFFPPFFFKYTLLSHSYLIFFNLNSTNSTR